MFPITRSTSSSASVHHSSPVENGSKVTQKKSSAKKAPANDFSMRGVTDNDILLGRGSSTAWHPGNVQFRALVSSMKTQYDTATKSGKSDIIDLVIAELESASPVPRFLNLDENTREFYQVDSQVARGKVSQAFRDYKDYKNESSEASTEKETKRKMASTAKKPAPKKTKTNKTKTPNRPTVSVNNYVVINGDVKIGAWIDPNETFHPNDFFPDIDDELESQKQEKGGIDDYNPALWNDHVPEPGINQFQPGIDRDQVPLYGYAQYPEPRFSIRAAQPEMPHIRSAWIDDKEVVQVVLSALASTGRDESQNSVLVASQTSKQNGGVQVSQSNEATSLEEKASAKQAKKTASRKVKNSEAEQKQPAIARDSDSKSSVKKTGSWTEVEDEIILNAATSSVKPFKSWSTLVPRLPGRISKQIRDRFVNHLNPNLDKTPFCEKDYELIKEGVEKYGRKWTLISQKVFHSTRAENDIKNKFYSSSFRKHIEQKYGVEVYNELRSIDDQMEAQRLNDFLNKNMRIYFRGC